MNIRFRFHNPKLERPAKSYPAPPIRNAVSKSLGQIGITAFEQTKPLMQMHQGLASSICERSHKPTI